MLDIKTFKIIDAIKDGSCLFKCMFNFLLYNLDNIYNRSINNNNIKEFIEKIFNILIENNILEYNNEYELIENKIKYLNNLFEIDEKLDSNSVDQLVLILQLNIKEYAFLNSTKNIPNFNINFENIILSTHDDNINTIEEYRELFNKYSGDEDYELIDSDIRIKSGINRGKIKQIKKKIPERWGGLSEIYAFSLLYEVNVSIYVIKRKTKSNNKIVNSTEKFNDSYFEEYFEYKNNDFKININLVLSQTKSPHYRLLI